MSAGEPRECPEPWPWASSLDALIAAPEFHTVLLENERVRVLQVRIRPGETVESLSERLLPLEHRLYVEAIQIIEKEST